MRSFLKLILLREEKKTANHLLELLCSSDCHDSQVFTLEI